MADAEKITIPVDIDFTAAAEAFKAAARAAAGMAAVLTELARTLEKIGVDKPSTGV
jgi:hypothetical protein